jgi:integration host factor subunit alpha
LTLTANHSPHSLGELFPESRKTMTTDTLTRADLTEAVFQAVGLSRNDSAQMVEDMLEEICSALSKGETVKLSSFGTFAVRQKAQRMGRNPKTGDEVPIAPRRVLVFRPSHVLKAMINGEAVSEVEVERE